jgi:hypothetical protein
MADRTGATSSRTRLVLAVVVLLSGAAGVFPGQAAAAPGNTQLPSRLSAQGICFDNSTAAVMLPQRFWASIYTDARLTGTISGLQPRHPYIVQPNWKPLPPFEGTPVTGVTTGAGVLRVDTIWSGETLISTTTTPAVDVYDAATLSDGSVPVGTTAGRAIGNDPVCVNVLRPGSVRDRLTNGPYTFVQQGDGNLVMYANGVARWQSGTGGNPGAATSLQSDGNLVVYSASGTPLWQSGTAGHPTNVYDPDAPPGVRLVAQSDGNVVLYGRDSRTGAYTPIWQTKTYR